MTRAFYLSLFFLPFLSVACASLSPLAERASQASLDCLEHQSEFHCNKALEAAENLVAVSEEGSSCATDATWLQSRLLEFLRENKKIENRKSVLDAISSLKKYCFGVR